MQGQCRQAQRRGDLKLGGSQRIQRTEGVQGKGSSTAPKLEGRMCLGGSRQTSVSRMQRARVGTQQAEQWVNSRRSSVFRQDFT